VKRNFGVVRNAPLVYDAHSLGFLPGEKLLKGEFMAKDTLEMWGEAIRFHRLEQGMTVDRLAELVGVDRSNVVRWEAGQTEPRIEHRLALSVNLDVPAEDLFRYPSG
jgi:DNA-binding XRE family transcriptional regulator